jgi:lysozyme
MWQTVRLVSVGVLLLVLAACGGGGGRSTHPVGLPAAFGDVDPHDWSGGRQPRDYPVHGIDVSRFQGQIDWPRVATSGVAFAFIKATEGGDRLDPMFDQNWRGAQRAGIPTGAYHFYYFCRSGADQARWFIRNVPRRALTLPPVLDMEWNHTSPTCRLRPDPETVRAEAADFLRIVGAHYGRRPVIYTTVDFWERNQMWKLGDYDFWLRSVAGHPQDVYDGHHWSFWQYTGTGTVPGITGKVDLNAFYGSPAAWARWKDR